MRGDPVEEEEHRLGMLLFPRYGRGGGHGFVPHPGLASHRSQAHWAVR